MELSFHRRSRLFQSKGVVSGAACLAMLAMVTACGGGAESSAETAKKLTVVKSITYPGNYYLTDVVAQEKGLFKKHGLDVRFIKPQSGVTGTQLMVSGQIGPSISDGALIVAAQSKGLDIEFVGSLFNRSAWKIYVSNKDKDLAGTAADNPAGLKALKGKKIGVTGIGAGTDIAIQSALVSAGMDPETDVKRVGIGLLPASIGQFEKGALDAYIYSEPADSAYDEQKLAHVFYTVSSDAPAEVANVLQGGMVASAKWLKTHQKEAKAWIAAQQEAVDWISDPANADEAGKMFAKAYGGDDAAAIEFVKKLAAEIFPHNLPGLKVPQEEFKNTVATLERLKLLQPGHTLTYEKSVAAIGRS